MFARAALSIVAWTLLSFVPALAQTYTNCNPRFSSKSFTKCVINSLPNNLIACPADTALGKSINIDFTQGSVDSFTASGNPTYDSSGAHFTVSKSGDSPTLTSLFYIMFGKVSITMKAAPGAGIVSTLVLQSDDLDEIDIEWLGADNAEVQTNYFGKGDTSTYDRGAFNPAANNQGQFITYTIEWTSEHVIWSVGGTVVRVLTPATADINQYPQTPMQIKFGAWSGGDPSNAPGTISWARGPTDYSKGPFTMTVQSIAISDYSTGTSYKYSGSSGNWQDIVAVGGSVNGNKGSSGSSVTTAQAASATSASPTIPVGGFGSSSSDSTKTGWPWVASQTTLTTAVATSNAAGIPSRWTVSGSGKIVPVSTAAVSKPPKQPLLFYLYSHPLTINHRLPPKPRSRRRPLRPHPPRNRPPPLALKPSPLGTAGVFSLP